MELDVAALLFDNDGVLVDSVEAGNDAWTRWAEEFDQDPAHVLASSTAGGPPTPSPT